VAYKQVRVMHKIEAHDRLEREHRQHVIAIDQECFSQEPSSTALTWAEMRPDMYNVLTVKGQVLGYGLVIPVTALACEALKRGEMSEDELTLKYITSVSRCAGLYLASMASTKKAGAIIRSRLVGYTMGTLLRAPKEVFTVAVTTDGASVAQELVGMSPSQYTGPMAGINGYRPTLFCRPPRGMTNPSLVANC
jgi:hypothetical protein